MPFRTLAAALLLCLMFAQTGCALIKPTETFFGGLGRALKFRPNDYRDTTDEPTDEWDFVGKDARGNRPVLREPDTWWQKYMMSEKARSIERNLGVE